MKVAILGFADQGRSAYEYWHHGKNEITICDQDQSIQVPLGTKTKLGDDYLKDLDKFDLLVRTPSIHPREIAAANPDSPNILDKVTSVTNEFLRICPTKNVVGVTGTKGKGTTSTLITEMLKAAGKRVHLGGNIGIPPLDLLRNNIKPDDWVVLELANFQLIDLRYSPHIGVCLMVIPEHLNWHPNVDEYVTAKAQMFARQFPGDTAIYLADDELSKFIASFGLSKKTPYMRAPGATIENNSVHIDGHDICKTSEIKLLGKHNWQNICAAVTAVWQVTQDTKAMRKVITGFSGLEHRLEFVRDVDGVKYYDDSFGTTPETAIVAIEAFKEPKVVILGGSDKGADYSELADVVIKNNVRSVVAIGITGKKIAALLRNKGYKNVLDGDSTMTGVVFAARSQAKPGDVVLLSTASASFDMFKNYKDRGEQFKNVVQSLT